MQVLERNLTANGFQSISNATLAAATALTVPADTKKALIQAEGVDVRWRDDGTNPDAATGMVIFAGGPAQWFLGNLGTVKFIKTADGATLNVSYYK